MNAFESGLLTFLKILLTAAPTTVPVFVHSTHGIAVANASEELAAAAISVITQQAGATNGSTPAAN